MASRPNAPMVDLGCALAIVWERFADLAPPAVERVPLGRAAGRVLAEEVVACRPVPEVPRAAMDGFAVGSRAFGPGHARVTLRVGGVVLPGRPAPALAPGEAVFVATGAVLPAGADAVVPREQAEWSPSATDPSGLPARGAPVALRPASPGTNVVPAGELVPAGVPVLSPGAELAAPAIGLLAALGRRSVRVRARPRVAILASGDELVPPGRSRPGATADSNAPMLRAACAALGADAVVLGPVPDAEEALRRAMEAALQLRPALVLTTGGVSVGPADLVPAAWVRLGAQVLFWRVAVKPGKPVLAALAGRTAVIGLSGSPLACWTAFTVLVAPLLRHWAGRPWPFAPVRRVRLAEPLGGGVDVLRLVWGEAGPGPGAAARPLRPRQGGALVHLARANALLVHPAGAGPLPAGSMVWALRTDLPGEETEADPREVLREAARPERPPRGGRGVVGGVRPPSAPGAEAPGARRARPDPAAASGVPGATAGPGALALPEPCGDGWPAAEAPAVPVPAAAPRRAEVPALRVLAVGGRSGHGKTTLVERLVARLALAGEAAATLKHHAHGRPLEAEGKDGFRHRTAGARLTAVSGPGGLLWSEDADGDEAPEVRLAEVCARARQLGCRWVLVEGYHRLRLPRVEVLDTRRARHPRCRVEDGLFLVAASDPARAVVPPGVAVLPREDAEAVLEAVRRRMDAAGAAPLPSPAGVANSREGAAHPGGGGAGG